MRYVLCTMLYPPLMTQRQTPQTPPDLPFTIMRYRNRLPPPQCGLSMPDIRVV